MCLLLLLVFPMDIFLRIKPWIQEDKTCLSALLKSVLLFHWNFKTWWQTTKFETTLPIFRRRQWHPTPVLLPGKFHGWRSLVGCSPWGRKESDMTEKLPFNFSLSCIGEGNGNPLQCSCLENPRDRRSWWASVYGVAQSRTQLTWLSSSSSSSYLSLINIFLWVLIEYPLHLRLTIQYYSLMD